MADLIITPSELAAYAPELDTSAYAATTISGMISRASERIQNYCNVDGFLYKAVVSETGRAHINSAGELIIQFRRRPVASGDVTRIALKTVQVNQSLTLTSGGDPVYFIPDPGGHLIYPSDFMISLGRGLFPFRGLRLMYEIDYSGGYATDVESLPGDLKEAATLLVRDIIATQHNQTGANSFSQGSYSVNYGASDTSKLVKDAMAILDGGGYVRRSI